MSFVKFFMRGWYNDRKKLWLRLTIQQNCSLLCR